MKVHKFGGASVKDATSIRRIPNLIQDCGNDRLFIVISAMGKTTNKLETIVNKAFATENYDEEFESLYNEHLNILKDLLPDNTLVISCLTELFAKCKDKIHTTAKEDYNFFYDQIVSCGELFSSLIVSQYLKNLSFDIQLIDAADIFISDDNWRAGNIDKAATKQNITNICNNNDNKILITQGFIAGDNNGNYVTLGREGSDYSAGILAALSNADELTFWKDVEGIYNADPKNFPNAIKIDKISYDEMIELSYFGAKVLHEKTLHSLRGKSTTLQIRSFLKPETQGTFLYNYTNCIYPPIIIVLKNQILFTVEPKTKSLIDIEHINRIYDSTKHCNININLIQISAIKISFCATYDEFACKGLISLLEDFFEVKYNTNVSLETIRHYKKEELKTFIKEKDILLTQISRRVAQFVIKEDNSSIK